MTNTKRGDGIHIVNNTGTDLRMFHDAIVDAILAGGVLPEELADVLTLNPVTVNGATRWVIDFV